MQRQLLRNRRRRRHTAVLVEQSAQFGILITNGEFVAMNGENPTQVVVTETNTGSIRFNNCAFWGPCEQIARLSGRGLTAFSDCEFAQWDRNAKGNFAINVEGGSVMIRGCNFQEDKNHVLVKETAQKAIVSENILRGAAKIQNDCRKACVVNNIDDAE